MPAGPRVVLIHPPQEVEREFIDYPYFTNLPALAAATALARRGLFVHLLDAFAQPASTVSPLRRGRLLFGLPVAALSAPLETAPFDCAIVHFTPFALEQETSHSLAWLLRRLRQRRPQARIIGAELYAGGMHRLALDPQRLKRLYPQLDAFLALEAEEALPDLVTADPLDRFLVEPDPVPPQTLADLTPPDWSLIDVQSFQRFLDDAGRLPKVRQYRVDHATLPAFFSRGCPFTCSFCSNPYRAYRAIPLDRAGMLLDDAAARGFARLFVLDDACNVRPDFHDLLSLIESRRFAAEFPNGLRADRLPRPVIATLARIAPAITVSAESAAPRVQQEIIVKSVDQSHVEQVAADCAQARLPLFIHWMAGIPGETRQELVATLDAARSLLDRFAAVPLVQFATPMPGARRFDAPATPEIGQRMQHAPTFLPEGVSANELILAVRLLRQRALAASTAKVIINLTYRCNNHCLFCAVGNRVKQDMPLDTVLALLRTHREQGISQLDLDGGEPTLHPDLMAVIAQAVRLGYHPINVTTNGRRLAYPDFAARLLGSGIHSLLISIHGPNSQVHDAITGVPGSFRETIAGIRNAMLMKPPHLDAGVNTTLSTGNVPLLRQLVEILYPLGVDKLNVQFVTPFGRASASSVPPPDQAARALRPVIEEWKDRIRFQVVNLPCCFLPGLEEFVAPDLGKLARNMVFVTLEEVNLYHYLAATRRYDNACASCLLRVACDGKFDFSEVLS